jgi:DNA repair exonuclease SbcCD ATPase subunit
MEILELHIRNFMSIGQTKPVALSGKGLVLIQGENDDDSSANSNGVGKSSIADALCWALYGKTARGVEGDAVVNKVAKKECSVSVVLQDGDVFYRITRYRKHKTYKNQTIVQVWEKGREDRVENVDKGTERETQALITSILGCTHEVFMAAIYAGQEVTPDLPAMTDKNLKMLIEEASGLQRLEKAYELANKEVNAVRNQLDAARSKVNAQSDALVSINARLLGMQNQVRDFEDKRAERSNQFKERAGQVVATVKKLQSSLDPELRGSLEREQEKINEQIASIKPMLEKTAELTTEVNSAAHQVDIAAQEVKRKTDEAQTLKYRVDHAAEAMKEPCETCGKPHTADEIEQYKAHHTERLKNALRELHEARKRHDEAVEEKDKRDRALAEHKAKVPDISHLHVRLREIQEELYKIAALETEIAMASRDAKDLVEKAKGALTEVNPFQAALQSLEEQVAEQSRELEEGKVKVKELEDQLVLAESVATVFSPSGVRAHILDTVTPFLNDRTSEYLATMSDGNITAVWTTLTTTAKGDLKEKFSIEVSNDKGAETFAGLSGGEKRKVRLATMLALQDLVASRATKPINLWIGDEIDDALDSAGLERLMTILDKKARERGTVLIISHNELRDWVDQVLTVRKVAGVSTIEGEL